MKIIYLALSAVTLFLFGCSSTYAQKDFSSNEKLYLDINGFSKDKNVKDNLSNDSSFIVPNNAIIKNDTINTAADNQKIKNNIIYLEFAGNGLFSSLNYEGILSNNFSIRLGIGYEYDYSVSNSGSHHTDSFFPLVMFNYLIDVYGNNYIELGGGALIASSAFSISDSFGPSTTAIVPTTAIGYRYSPKDGGFFFSAAFDMFIVSGVFPWGGIGFGIRF